MVYLGSSLALAALATLVHAPRFKLLEESYVYFEVTAPDELLLELDPTDLPADWRAAEIPKSTQPIGDAWYRSRASLLLSVPSRVMPQERNVLLNPEHPESSKVELRGPLEFKFDERLET
ncbi:hypothetical protein BH24DEI2_BH24DEI2_06150 [soil metagenome]